ncbi:MAG: mannitol dehydrogenase family protein [Pseudomonadota bacterium]
MNRIVHLGPGAFFKAHLAAYTQDAADAGDRWDVVAISLLSARAKAEFQGPYTLLERSLDGTRPRQIDVVREVLHLGADREAAMAALVSPETKVVSLTVTEKAYAHGGADSVPHLLASTLDARRAAGIAPFTCLSCDNLPSNGAGLRRLVGAWSDVEDVAFPSTMVDRITPARTASTLAEGGPAAEECEAFRQWVIEDDFPQGRPAWEAGGAQFVSDVTPYEKMKLRMLNGAHSMIAYAGVVRGFQTVREAMADAEIANRVRAHMTAAAATLNPLPCADFAAYGEALEARFRNPHLAHETYQIAMDGSQKMPQRVLAPALDALERGQDISPFAFATAAWLAYLRGPHELRDPRAEELTPPTQEHIFALPDLVPPALAQSPLWRRAVAAALEMF